jgi:uncharacterized membrane protein
MTTKRPTPPVLLKRVDRAAPAGGGAAPADRRAATGAPPGRPSASAKERIVGLDLARGVALIGMLAVHVFYTFDSNGSPSLATTVAAGRSAATFATVAGVGIALLTGGRRTLGGLERAESAAGIAGRALMIGLIGLTLGYVTTAAGLPDYVILVYYAAMFLLAIPLLGLRTRALVFASLAFAVIGPVVVSAADLVPDRSFGIDPRLGDLVHHPAALALEMALSGAYPVVAWLAYICAGLAIGRLDLTSRRVALWMVAGGLALATAAWWASSVLLFQLGGLRQLRAAAPPGTAWTDAQLLWDPPAGISSWWWLAGRAPHSTTPFDMFHTLGAAVAVLGAALLLSRVALVRRLLRPIADAGSMVLTLYVGHLLVLSTGVLDAHPHAQFVLLLAALIAFAVGWRRYAGRGPLERVVSWAAARARTAYLSWSVEQVRSESRYF